MRSRRSISAAFSRSRATWRRPRGHLASIPQRCTESDRNSASFEPQECSFDRDVTTPRFLVRSLRGSEATIQELDRRGNRASSSRSHQRETLAMLRTRLYLGLLPLLLLIVATGGYAIYVCRDLAGSL